MKQRCEQAADEQVAQKPQRHVQRPCSQREEGIGDANHSGVGHVLPLAAQQPVGDEQHEHQEIPGDQRHHQRLQFGDGQRLRASLKQAGYNEITRNDGQQRNRAQPHNTREDEIDDVEETGVPIIDVFGYAWLYMHESHEDDAQCPGNFDALGNCRRYGGQTFGFRPCWGVNGQDPLRLSGAGTRESEGDWNFMIIAALKACRSQRFEDAF